MSTVNLFTLWVVYFVGCPAEWYERTHPFAMYALTPTSTYSHFIIICTFYFPKYHTKQDFVFKYHILQFIYNANRIFKSWEFDHSPPSSRNKQSVVSFPARRTRPRPSAGRTCPRPSAGHTRSRPYVGHMTILTCLKHRVPHIQPERACLRCSSN